MGSKRGGPAKLGWSFETKGEAEGETNGEVAELGWSFGTREETGRGAGEEAAELGCGGRAIVVMQRHAAISKHTMH